MKERLIKLVTMLVLIIFMHSPVFGEDLVAEPGRVIQGEEMFVACGFCHGVQGQGGPALDAPPLAGMAAWYVENQLNAFRDGIRGVHADDIPGLQMSIVSGMTRNQSTIKSLAEYIESMPTDAAPEKARDGSVAGTDRPFIWRSKYAQLTPPKVADKDRGAAIYRASCVACHGANAEGNRGLNSPELVNLPDWYQHRQLQYYQDGLRGADARDVHGVQMAAFAKLLNDDQQIADVVAFIISLGADK